MTGAGRIEEPQAAATSLLRLFLAFGLTYVVCFPFQTLNAVIAPKLVEEFGLNPSQLGLLTASYLLAFAIMQIPLGLALDHYGPRRVEALLMLVAASGSLLFATAQIPAMLFVGRLLIGAGVSGCLMAAFKAFRIWMPAERTPLANAAQLAAGGIGGMLATVPVEFAIHSIGWRLLFGCMALLTLGGGALILSWVPDLPPAARPLDLHTLTTGVVRVFRSPAFRRLAPWAVTGQSTFIALFSLWAGPWLREKGQLSSMQAAQVLLGMSGAMLAGYLISGRLAERALQRQRSPMQVAGTGMLIFAAVQVLLCLNITAAPALLWMSFSFAGAFCMLPYAIIPVYFAPELGGRVVTSLNLLVFGSAFAAQWLVGAVLEATPSHYGYSLGFGLLLLPQLLAAGWYALRAPKAV